MKQPTQKQAKRAALLLHSLIVRDAATGCAARSVLPGQCGGPLQCAHIVPKAKGTQSAIEPLNAWTLCAGHHRMVDNNPARWLALADATNMTEYAREFQADCDNAAEYGLFVGDVEGIRRRMSRLTWWRHKVLELLDIAEHDQISTKTVPAYIKAWAAEQNRQTQ